LILVELLWTLAVLAQLAALVISGLRRRLASLPQGLPRGGDAPPVVLLKPVLRSDQATLARCRAWIESAQAYPGRAAVVFSTVTGAAGALSALARKFSAVEVQVTACSPQRRRLEPGLDKAHRLMDAEELAHELLAGEDGILLTSDEDVDPLDRRGVERLVAGAPHPGVAATVTNAPALPADAPWHTRVSAVNMAFNNQVYALADVLVRREQSVLLGWTTAIWASDLRGIGGFASTARDLTEEVRLGIGCARRGVGTLLFDASGAFANREDAGSLAAWWHQQVRWRAQLRACPLRVLALMLLLLPLSFPLLLAVASFAASPGIATAALVASALLVCQQTLGLEPRRLWIAPCHEILALFAQVAGGTTRRVRWGAWEYRTNLRSGIVAKSWRSAPESVPAPAPVGSEAAAFPSGQGA
jgi:hypothetical protein